MQPGDSLLLGADLVKDPQRLEAAYDDAAGVTAAFNANVLLVLNAALGADFDPERFDHVARFDADAGWIEMLLRAREAHTVNVPDLDLDVHFAEGEEMRTEVSAKFTPEQLQAELAAAGFELARCWTDEAGDFSLSLAVRDGAAADIRHRIRHELEQARARSVALLAPLPDEDQVRQHSPLMSPLVWDLAHIGHFEELWLRRELLGASPSSPEYDQIYDAFKQPRHGRASLPLLGPAEARGFVESIRAESLRLLERIPLVDAEPLLRDGFVFGLVAQHEQQHVETMLADAPAARRAVPARRRAAARAPAAAPCRGARPGGAVPPRERRRPVGLRQRASATRGGAARVLDRHDPGDEPRVRRVHRRRRLPRPELLERDGLVLALRGLPGAPAVLASRRGRRLEPLPLRPLRARPARRARAARLLVRGRRLRPLDGQAPPHRARVGEGRLLGSRRRSQATLPLGGRGAGQRAREPRRPPLRSGTGRLLSRRGERVRRPPARRRRLGVDGSDFRGYPGFEAFPYREYSRGLLRDGVEGAARRLVGDPSARRADDLPQLGLPDPEADLRGVPVRSIRLTPCALGYRRSVLRRLLTLAAVVLSLGAVAPGVAQAAIPMHPCDRGSVLLCGTVTVPLDYSGKTPGFLKLAVQELPTKGQVRGTMFMIAGGPGQGSIEAYGLKTQGSFFQQSFPGYNLVTFDDRGTGISSPLSCPFLEQRIATAGIVETANLTGICGRDLGDYRLFFGTADHANDVEQVRLALGLGKIGVYGVSYGTKESEAYALAYPNSIERILLDSVVVPEGPDLYALDTLAKVPEAHERHLRQGQLQGPHDELRRATSRLSRTASRPSRSSSRTSPTRRSRSCAGSRRRRSGSSSTATAS